MTLISLVKASIDFGLGNLFSDLDLHINERERLGLIGPNGAGKSTLLKVIAGKESLVDGERRCSPLLRISLVNQNSALNESKSILEVVLQGCGGKADLLLKFHKLSIAVAENPEQENLLKKLGRVSELMDEARAWNLEYQCKEILRKLGIKDLNQPIKDLSGGYQKRVALASALVANPDVLLLDEPTNHLDASAVEWFQSWLETYKGALVLVTHDRYVLDVVAKRMIEVNRGVVRKYFGNYASFLKQKIDEENIAAVTKKKFQGILRKELAWLIKGPKARSTKQKARIERISKMQSKTFNDEKYSLEINSISKRIGKVVIEAEDIGLTIDGKENIKYLLNDFSYSFSPEDRVGIIGSNGCGKSSLLDLFARRRKTNIGNIKFGETIQIGYLDQQTQDFNNKKLLNRRVIEFVEEAAMRVDFQGQQISASQLLEKFLFLPSQQHKPLSKLSGGEKRRLALCKMLINRPNVLLLDEPTNDLDIYTLRILEDFIEDFKGCVIIVSHDRYFLDRTVDRIFNFEDGKLIRYEGNYTSFLSKKIRKDSEKDVNSPVNNKSKKLIQNNNEILNNNEMSIRRISFKEARELKEIDELLPKLETKKSLIEKNISSGKGNIDELSLELAEVVKTLDEYEERWIALSELSK